jgi:CRP-like cAMP-binding protein
VQIERRLAAWSFSASFAASFDQWILLHFRRRHYGNERNGVSDGPMNHILEALSAEGKALLSSVLEPVKLRPRQELELPNRKIQSVYFIETGVAGVLTISDGDRVVVGLIGCEGASGIGVFLGDDRSPNSTVMLTSGTGLRVSTDQLRRVMRREEVRNLLSRYALAYFNQAEHTALSNALTSATQRVARLVLMAHDRVPTNTIDLTHETIAFMLGTRRAGVTTALNEFQSNGLVRLGRGTVTVVNRSGLEELVGHFYGIPEREFVRLVGTFWPPMLTEGP